MNAVALLLRCIHIHDRRRFPLRKLGIAGKLDESCAIVGCVLCEAHRYEEVPVLFLSSQVFSYHVAAPPIAFLCSSFDCDSLKLLKWSRILEELEVDFVSFN